MIKLTVNGQEKEFTGDAKMPLLWFLRDLLGLTGTKYGCGKGLCGACTVHLDGKAIRSCTVNMEGLEGVTITTIEGLGAKAEHPVQRSWAIHDVPQCGYCQSGQIMQAAALLNENPGANAQEVDDAMSGVLCRCGTYQRIRTAVLAAGEDMI